MMDDITNLLYTVFQLILIARNNETKGADRDVFLNDVEKPKVREIGEKLHVMGGFKLMQGVYTLVKKNVSATDARHLELAWDGISDWRG